MGPDVTPPRPPHGGYPTPDYADVSLRRRLTSQRMFRHQGAYCSAIVDAELAAAAEGRAISYEDQTEVAEMVAVVR
jgi:hypothetical protein